ncbi:MAG TPA: antitoxin MazE family protein [Acidocella sp.]|nr:antitoxin MazE family protein [Acidocella sp.]
MKPFYSESHFVRLKMNNSLLTLHFQTIVVIFLISCVEIEKYCCLSLRRNVRCVVNILRSNKFLHISQSAIAELPDRIRFPYRALHDRLHVTYLENRVMASARGVKPTKVKVQEHRDRLRAQGLRPIQIWVPDVRASSFRSEAHRQSLAVAASVHAAEDQAFIDAVSAWDDE